MDYTSIGKVTSNDGPSSYLPATAIVLGISRLPAIFVRMTPICTEGIEKNWILQIVGSVLQKIASFSRIRAIAPSSASHHESPPKLVFLHALVGAAENHTIARFAGMEVWKPARFQLTSRPRPDRLL